MRLSEVIPNHLDLLLLEPEEVAGVLLEFMHTVPSATMGQVHPSNVISGTELNGYPASVRDECFKAFEEAWSVLVREGMLALELDHNHGHYLITRKAAKVKTRTDFSAFRLARQFPKEIIHPTLLADIYPSFLRGQYEAAIFQAFKLIEVRVRDACPEFNTRIGVDLMNNAFRPADGPLTNATEPASEQQALMFLFAGAIGRFKNPGSHRLVPDLTAADAIEAIQFASHLLRVVDERAQRRHPSV
jgi:uncharacterized protein (TIGR02391 family)